MVKVTVERKETAWELGMRLEKKDVQRKEKG